MNTVNDSYPRSWSFDDDGETVEGTFVELGEAPTAGYGYKPILTLSVDGESRTIWIFHQALAEKLRDELGRRKTRDFTVGERIKINRSERKTSEATGRSYVPYRVSFPDAPKRTAADVLGGAVDDDDEPEAAAEEDDDVVPF
jgi:hypothetical protein